MTLTAYPLTVSRKNAAVAANLHIHSTEPGTLGITYPAGITGDATKTVEGTRVWQINPANGYQWGWNAPAACDAATSARDGVTICFDVDLGYNNWQNFSNVFYDAEIIAQNYNEGTTTNLLNWGIGIRTTRATFASPAITYAQTPAPPTASASGGNISLNAAVNGKLIRCALLLSGTAITLYYHDGTTKYTGSTTRTAPTGTVATPCLACYSGARFAYFSSILADDANGIDAWLAGNCPANPVVYYPCNEEVPDTITAAPYDASTNGYDGIYNGDATYPITKTPRVYTDTTPVVPAVTVPITIAADATAGDHTITITRARQGVPARASDEEKYETVDVVVTVAVEAGDLVLGPDLTGTVSAFPVVRRLVVASPVAGAVTLASDSAKVAVPASVTVVDGLAMFDAVISGEVSGVTLTATQGTSTGTCGVSLTLATVIPPSVDNGDTLSLFPAWQWTEPHTQAIAAMLDTQRTEWIDTLFPSLLIFDFDNQTSDMLDRVAEMFRIFGWNKAAGDDEKVAFLRNSLKILRKSGTPYAVKEAIKLVVDAAKIETITLIEGTGGIVYDGTYDFDGSIDFDSHYHWARFSVEIETTDAAYFTAEIQGAITSMINHYKPASRWLESLIITEI